jgi:beta-fructofuranosidase
MARPLPHPDPALRERLARDPHRPRYHFLPPHNWLNDPNGVIQFNGEYHLFYQYNPDGPVHGNIHWGHAVSRDLVHWQHLPIALAPDPGSPDEAGVWSGCAVDADGTPVAIYTGVGGPSGREQQVCVAFGDPQLRTLTKHPGNPVIAGGPPDLELVRGRRGTVEFRDPCVWRESDGWYLAIGSGIAGVGGTALLFRSPDLLHWDYLHPLCVGDANRRDPLWTGIMWECPDFFPLGDRHVLMFSAWDNAALGVIHQIGTYADHRFVPEREAVTDYGRWYAPQSFEDQQGRRIDWGWIREGRTVEAQVAAGWSGAMALPRVLTLTPNGDLAATPAPEYQALRRAHRHFAGRRIAPDRLDPLDGATGAHLELLATLDPGDADRCGLLVRRSPAGEEETRIVYDRAAGTITLDRSRSTLDPASDPTSRTMPAPLAPDGTLRLHLFLDASILELFVAETVACAERIYPTRPDSLGLALFASGGTATLRTLDLWELAIIWEE